MHPFLVAHATHPDWRMAVSLVAAQLRAQRHRADREPAQEPREPTLGLVYLTDHYSPHAPEILEALRQDWTDVRWAGTVGVGVAATGVEYFDEPALAVMLTTIPHGRFRVFSGAQPLQSRDAWTALVHADPATPDLAELVAEMSDRTGSGYLFGGLTASRGPSWQIADRCFQGGLSGVAFSRDVPMLSRVTQGSQPIGRERTVTACDGSVVLRLDDEPALECLARDLDVDLSEPRKALPRLRGVLVGVRAPRETPPDPRPSRVHRFGDDVRVRHLVGLDPTRGGFAVAERLTVGDSLALCRRDVEAARRDLVRICSEMREELAEPMETAVVAEGDPGPVDTAQRVAGALYVSCSGRGGPHFGGPSAELQIVQRALGDVPLVGFFAGGEIGHHHIYGYTGVLTVFTREG